MNEHNTVCRWLLGAALAAGAMLAHAQPVGRVLLAAGDVFAVRDGKPVRLQFNSPIEFKDTLRTGAASSLQVLFVDEGMISLRENTEFVIEEYRFGGKEDGTERGFFALVKGGFRAVTGLIGRTRNANYRVRSETATIGIRGTDYAVRDCRGDCGAGVKDGLYGSVLGQSSGTNRITLDNKAGQFVFGINQHFYVPDAAARPQPLLQPPTFVAVKPQGKAQAAQQGGSGTGGEQAGAASGASAESRPQSVVDASAALTGPAFVNPYTITNTNVEGGGSAVFPIGDLGFLGADTTGLGAGVAFSSQLTIVDQGGIAVMTEFRNVLAGDAEGDDGPVTGTKGSLPVLDAGCVSATVPGCTVPTDPNISAFWGRWQNGTFTDDEGTRTFDFTAGNSTGLHYLAGFNLTPYSVIASKTGVGEFSPVFGTNPTNSLGQAGTSTFGVMFVTFGASPSANLTSYTMTFPAQSYSFSNVPLSITSDLGGKVAGIEFQGTAGTCTGSCNPTNFLEIQGGFAGPNGDHAGLVLFTQNGSITTNQVKLLKCFSGC